MDRAHLQLLAGYNRWANARLYAAALALPDADYRRDTGVFFGSLHGTLNHILAADRIWLRRITGSGEAPDRLDAILFGELVPLARARMVEDERLVALADDTDADALAAPLHYASTRGDRYEQQLGTVLTHLFNHHTHHRGQAHACLSIVSKAEPPQLDLIMFTRGVPAPSLAELLEERKG